jgi:hypothetical protein
MLMTMSVDFSLLFSYPHDNHFKEEEILLQYLHCSLNTGAILYYT